MKALLIIANPSKTSFSHAMATAYKQKIESTGGEVEILDLYDFEQDVLQFESTAELQKWNCNGGEKMKLVHEKITNADEMSFFFPIWWGNMPAILKNFFDVNFSANFAFKFVKGSKMPEKLLTNKTAKIFTHCDAPWFIYKWSFVLGINFRKYVCWAILSFCGIKTTGFLMVDNLRNKTDEQRKKILEKIAK